MDNPVVTQLPFRPRILSLWLAALLGGVSYHACADDIQFNTDVLDITDRDNIDLSQFARSGYIMPGDYTLKLFLNKKELGEFPVSFHVPEDDPKGSLACITPEMVETFALKPAAQNVLTWWHNGECLVMSSLEGSTVTTDLGSNSLQLGIPQVFLEYQADNWEPPSRWEQGIPGVLLDYNVNSRYTRLQGNGSNSVVSGNGTVGANLGAWRVRADWQGNYTRRTGSPSEFSAGATTQRHWEWSRYYAYRALPQWQAKVTLGDNFLYSDIFDSLRFVGVGLATDDNMLPPNLRGYAPEVTGVARSHARVIVSQQGRVLYETQVAAGPFRIQDISDAFSGQLDVRVEEQDGSVQTFQVNTATIPYLTRPGMVRYKLAAGRPSNAQQRAGGATFVTGEVSWGISNGWSLYGGGIGSRGYNALALGLGRDLLMFGALSFDVTQSRASLPRSGILTGGSYRLSYSKRFEQTDSQVTFAGYRFSERNFLSMGEYLESVRVGYALPGNSKEMYTVTFNQQLRDLGLSVYLNYSHQTYWDRPQDDRYSLTLARNFSLGSLRNLNVSLTGYRNVNNGVNDDGLYVSLNLPWGSRSSLSYNASQDRNNRAQQLSYFSQQENGDTYQLSGGEQQGQVTLGGSYAHAGSLAQTTISADYQSDSYTSMGLMIQGGATATLKGAALHRSNILGGTRLLVDTDGVAGIPIRGGAGTTRSNIFGKAVTTEVNSYYPSQVNIDVNALPETAEATKSVVQATLTEGAIGYRRFGVIDGLKAMAVIKLADGSVPPFGATVMNSREQEVGIVNDGGSIYLSGIKPNAEMSVHWSGKVQCTLTLPPQVAESMTTDLLLPCLPPPAGQTAMNTAH